MERRRIGGVEIERDLERRPGKFHDYSFHVPGRPGFETVSAEVGNAIWAAADPIHAELNGACRLAMDLGYATGHADTYDDLIAHVREQRASS